ncbi:hypothetical protein MMC19_000583 [Ptychographa xylographoides]|nr:hypothetical protein [Ptychographa xylographoides]
MKLTALVFLTTGLAAAQHNASTANGCNDGFFPGTDTVIYTVPYTYAAVMSIIGSFQNLTWSGNPPDTVSLNGSDNTVGTARTYNNSGAHVIETLTVYQKPPNGPYVEIHELAPLVIPAAGNLSFYADFDGTTVVEVCGGAASTFNLTIDFCATNATLAQTVLHGIHLTDAQTVGVFLGNQNFTSCAALNASSATATGASASPTITPFMGAAPTVGRDGWKAAGVVGLLAAVVL